jgi:hypothetical protein
MSDEKFDPVKVGDSLANLKGLADFVDNGIPAPTSEHDRSVGASPPDAILPDPKKAITGKPTTEELLALNATPEGRAKVAAMFGIVNREAVADVIDVPPEMREQMNDLAQRVGGEDKFQEIERRYDEANSLFAFDEELDDRPLTPAERNQAALKLLAMTDVILSDPARAQAELDDFDARDFNDPVKRKYFAGDRDTMEMVYKLRQAAAGEPVVGLPKSKINDGRTY